MNTVNEMFESYLKSAYPDTVLHPVQLQELRRAFYAGVWGGLNLSGRDHEAAYHECAEFKKQVPEGKN